MKLLELALFLYMCSHKKLVSSYSLLVSMLSHSSVFTSPLGRSPPFWLSFPDMVAAVTIACDIKSGDPPQCNPHPSQPKVTILALLLR